MRTRTPWEGVQAADRRVAGRHGGTFFLLEIGEMSPAIQVKILRALQAGEVRRVGSNQPVTVDVRVLAATNRDLTEMMRQGTFREDLFYRLNVIPVVLPPLRERQEGIPILAEHCLARSAQGSHAGPPLRPPDSPFCRGAPMWAPSCGQTEISREPLRLHLN